MVNCKVTLLGCLVRSNLNGIKIQVCVNTRFCCTKVVYMKNSIHLLEKS